MTCLRIADRKNNCLSFDMRDILKELEDIGPNLDWYILDVEGQGLPNADTSIMKLERDISAQKAIVLTWKQLRHLADQIFQTNNCIVVGISPGQDPPRLPLDDKYSRESVVIIAFDSSFWTVCVQQSDIIKRLEQAFRDTVIVDRAEPNYSG
jgi:hypothetical protein